MTKIAVVIPCFRVRKHILDVLNQIGPEINSIYVIDDACPEETGKWVQKSSADRRIKVLFNPTNLGVGGAVIRGYQEAIADQMDIVVKIDGDGQMDLSIIRDFIEPIQQGEADYTKGNRFFDLENINRMPKMRLIGNSLLSFMSKISTGYWNIFDPNNGYTAIHTNLIKKIAFTSVSKRYFFESDMLFRLNILKAVVVDIPMDAKYGDEKSNLSVTKSIGEFFYKHNRNFLKRIFYNYYLRDMSLASFELPCGLFLLIFGAVYGLYNWHHYSQLKLLTPLGTVMVSALSLLFGLQFILAFLSYDIASVPRRSIHSKFN
jgi:glycosyltransferase involved in cell wall biosynthesis